MSQNQSFSQYEEDTDQFGCIKFTCTACQSGDGSSEWTYWKEACSWAHVSEVLGTPPRTAGFERPRPEFVPASESRWSYRPHFRTEPQQSLRSQRANLPPRTPCQWRMDELMVICDSRKKKSKKCNLLRNRIFWNSYSKPSRRQSASQEWKSAWTSAIWAPSAGPTWIVSSGPDEPGWFWSWNLLPSFGWRWVGLRISLWA